MPSRCITVLKHAENATYACNFVQVLLRIQSCTTTLVADRADVFCSPCLKLKPVSKSVKSGYLTVNVETYGGGLWHTWFDRDLSVAGRVLVQEGNQLKHKLVPFLCSMTP